MTGRSLAVAMSAIMPVPLAWVVVPAALMGQELVRIPSTPTCPKCRIELEHVVTLGGSPEDSVDASMVLRRNAAGEYASRSRWAVYQVAMFSATGQLLKLHGSSGEGPGDYGRVDFLRFGRGDTLHLFDAGLRRETLLVPGSWTVGRTVPLPVLAQVGSSDLGPNAYLLLPDGRYIVNAERGDSALHLVGVDGKLVRSFGVVGYREDYPPPPSNRVLSVLTPYRIQEDRRFDVIARQLAAAGGGRIWAAYVNRYELELWDTAGHRLRRLARDAEWFEPWRSDEKSARRRRHILRERERRRASSATPRPPRPPYFWALQQDDRGRIWTLISVEHEPSGSDGPREKGGRDARIEVLDPRGGLIASVRLGWTAKYMDFVGPGLVAVQETRPDDGVEMVKVFRMVLVEG